MAKPQPSGTDSFIKTSTFGSFYGQCPLRKIQTNEIWLQNIFIPYTVTNLNTSGSISSVLMEKSFSLMWNHYRLLSAFNKQINVRVSELLLNVCLKLQGFFFFQTFVQRNIFMS